MRASNFFTYLLKMCFVAPSCTRAEQPDFRIIFIDL